MKLTAETFKDYAARLEKSGIKSLGEGSFGKVYQHPTYNNVAVKIVRKDPANAKWLSFCVANKGNPYLPKLYGVQSLDLEGSKHAYAVFMEKLNPCPIGAWLALKTKLAPTYSEEWFLHVNSPRVWARLVTKEKEPNLLAVATFFSRQPLGSLDLNQSNLLLRGKQIVFVDPVS